MPPRPRRKIFRVTPQNQRVEKWVCKLQSPDPQDVPSWYIKAKAALEVPAEEPKIQQPTRHKYNLRSAPQPYVQIENSRVPPRSEPAMAPKRKRQALARLRQRSPVTTVGFSDDFMNLDRAVESRNDETSFASTRKVPRGSPSGLQRLISLQVGLPPFSFQVPLQSTPASIQQLYRKLHIATLDVTGLIPGSLRDRLQNDYPWDQPHDSYFSEVDNDFEATLKASHLYSHVERLYSKMKRSNGLELDHEENALYPTVQEALEGCSPPSLELSSATLRNLIAVRCTTNSVNVEELPFQRQGRHSRVRIPSVRIDLLLGYLASKAPVAGVLKAGDRVGTTTLLPLKGMEKVFLGAVPVEVKTSAGDGSEAWYQLTVCGSAMLRVRHLWATSAGKVHDPETPPAIVGLTVTGHTWNFYLLYLGRTDAHADATGERNTPDAADGFDTDPVDLKPRVVLGPFLAGDTSTIMQTFKLVRFLTVLRQWVAEEWAPSVFEELAAEPPDDLFPTEEHS